MKLTDYVDVFLGTGPVELPKPQGIAAKWRFIKGLEGNTSPAAALPFGKFSACAYSGGYSAGYGNIGVNSGEPLREIMPKNTIRGFSHVQMSGTGYTGTFYNYAVAAPFYGDISTAYEPDIICRESARPGYYAAEMHGVFVELTMSKNAAHHRYIFPKVGGRIAIDFTNDGLFEERTRMAAEDLQIEINGDMACVSVILHGLRLYFAVWCAGARCEKWGNGVIFNITNTTARMALGLSPRSMDIAIAGANEVNGDFDMYKYAADEAWEKALSAIEIDAVDERDTRIFYSNFYHTLIKPCDFSGESFLYSDEEDFVTDFATLWDQYKTQLPLLYTLYPEISKKIVNTCIAFCRSMGRMPHRLYLDKSVVDGDDQQAKMLAEHTIYDAWKRGVEMNIYAASNEIRREVMPENRFADYKSRGVCDDIAHTMDLADGFNVSAEIARAAGDAELAEFCENLRGKWVAAYDRETGLLSDKSRFYEGNHWNYSFRLMHDMPTRLEIAGGKARYAELLDEFFGFTGENPAFEGFNNETDMETPYAYHYAERQDRVCEVVRAGLDYMFTDGRGGIPGNNDSGGLSSLYMWNMSGVFPVSGQDLMLVGSPRLKKTVFHLANGNTFTVKSVGNGIYTQRATLNGRNLENFEFSASEMMNGGELIIEMA